MDLSVDVLYEDNHLIAINKRPSQIVQSDKTGDPSLAILLKEYIRKKYDKPGDVYLGIIHRLDRPASGIVLFARTSKALTRMNKLFRDGRIEKTYWVITGVAPPLNEDRLDHYLKKNEKQNKSYVFLKPVTGSKLASLEYRLLNHSDRYFLLEVRLLTGRHHQIRCQLAHIGCPVKGDLKYGFPRSNRDGSIGLHARSLSFIHPVIKEQVVIHASPPEDKLWVVLTNSL
ncbi:MAG: pseudouridine synthase [Bacteroides sp. SM23_62_1]|nr:MAG: pseudouridine synthase [Bacteroides sp. SM23_62_1]